MLKKIDRYLLIHYPFLWVSKPHYITIYTFLFAIIFLMAFGISVPTPTTLSSNGRFSNIDVIFLLIILTALGSIGFWSRRQNIFNEYSLHDKRKGKGGVIKLLIYSYCVILIIGVALLLISVLWNQISNLDSSNMEMFYTFRDLSSADRDGFQIVLLFSLLYVILLLTYRKTTPKYFSISIIVALLLFLGTAIFASQFYYSDEALKYLAFFQYLVVIILMLLFNISPRFLAISSISMIIFAIATPILVFSYAFDVINDKSLFNYEQRIFASAIASWFIYLALTPIIDKLFLKLDSSPK